MLIAGVDEAGRGPVIGPLVLCAFAVAESAQQQLKKMGVRDSKLLTAGQREKLRDKLEQAGEFVVKKISAEELTQLMKRKISLNEIEAKSISEMLRELGGKKVLEKAYVDAPDPVASKFEKRIRKYFDHEFQIVCEHKADVRYPVVGAASIIAKTERDAEIAEIKNFLKDGGVEDWDFGTGYSHDERTIGFLKEYHSLPLLQPFIRHQWETAKKLKFTQLDLAKYF